MKDNIPGFMGYYVSKTGSVYSRYVRGSRGKLSNEFTPLIPKKVEVVKDRWSDGIALEISHNGWQITAINDLDLEDLKKLRKVI